MICERCGTVFCDDWAASTPDSEGGRRRFCSETCKKKTTPSYKASKKAATHAQRQLKACARQGKIRYKDDSAARAVASLYARAVGGRTYPYECACGGWHLTKQVPATLVARFAVAASTEGTPE